MDFVPPRVIANSTRVIANGVKQSEYGCGDGGLDCFTAFAMTADNLLE
jgi:hypothetical protein